MDEMKYGRVMQAMTTLPWAILPEKLTVIHGLLAMRARGERVEPDEVAALMAAAGSRLQPATRQGVAVLPLIGTIIPRGNMLLESSGAVSVQRFSSQLRAALADPEVGAIVIDVDSPGGQVGGVAELAAEIRSARGTKPITAVANTLMASAAYWIASAADEVVASPSAQVGSVGVFAVHEDWSAALANEGLAVTLVSAGRYKTEGNPYEPLGDDARAAMQEMVDAYYGLFVQGVAQGRGVSETAVREGFGEGRVVTAETAVALGMADRVATIDEVIGGALAELSSPAQALRGGADDEFRKRRLRAYGVRPMVAGDSDEWPDAGPTTD